MTLIETPLVFVLGDVFAPPLKTVNFITLRKMVRASTRSKTTASVNAAKAKVASSPNKKTTAASNAAKVVAAKSKSQSKAAKPTAKPTRTLTRGRKSDPVIETEPALEKENVDINTIDDDPVPDVEIVVPTEVEHIEEDNEPLPSIAEKITADESGDKDSWCICNGVDDGSPMIKCEQCDNWFHFRCISLTEPEAEDIKQYVCQPCSQSTEQRTEMIWEPKPDFPDAGVDVVVPEEKQEDTTVDDPDEDEESGDDYVDEDRIAKINKRKSSTRVQAVSPTSTEEEEEETHDTVRHRRRRPSSRLMESGASASYMKRRKSLQSGEVAPASKKVKAEKPEPPAEDDPVRKYCLGKLNEVITPIFVQYSAHSSLERPADSQVDDKPPQEEGGGEGRIEEAKAKALAFVEELEKSMFEHYSELDKKGRKVAAARYKERFRMLTFNLEKEDRVILRENVARGVVSGSDLSQMSSTDLANERTKQEIESAHLESLKHSILEVRKAPRAKITHKGEQMIEDVDGDVRAADDIEGELLRRELPMQESEVTESEEAKGHHSPGPAGTTDEREDMTAQNSELDAPMSPLVHAESPVAGGFDISEVLGDMGLPEETPIGSNSSSTRPHPHITIPRPSHSPTRSPIRSASFSAGHSTSNSLLASALLSASKSTPVSATFNLNSVWGQADARDGGEAANADMGENQDGHSFSDNPGPAVGGEMAENEFDMFFDRGDLFEPADEADNAEADMDIDDDDVPPVQEDEEAKYHAMPVIWSGEVSMPTEADSAWTSPVSARQIGGHSFEHMPSLWSRLFTSHTTRIDGRVPVDSSTNYLVTTRLNPTKELIAVGLTPVPGSDDTNFNRLLDFLISKGRHALVFPWANIPADRAIGKDLYLIPLKPDQPIPEYIELLDDVKLPRTRRKNMLLGVFVLHKGRLHTAAPPTTAPAVVPMQAPLMPVMPPPQPAIPGLTAGSGMIVSPVDPSPPIAAGGALNLSAEQRILLQSLIANGGMSVLGKIQSPSHGTTPPHPGQIPPPQAAHYPPYPPYPSHSPPHHGYYPPPLPPAPYAGSQSPYQQLPHHGVRPPPIGGHSPPRDYRGPPPGDYPRRRRPSDDYDYGPPRRGSGPPGRGRYDNRDRRDSYDRPPRDSGWSSRGGRRGGR